MTVNKSSSLLPVPVNSLIIPQRHKLLDTEVNCPIYLSLVLPTYNEAKNIETIVEQLSNLLDTFLPQEYELILVDDNSPDATWKLAQSMVTTYPQLKVMRRTRERGLSTAVIRGWQASMRLGNTNTRPQILIKQLLIL